MAPLPLGKRLVFVAVLLVLVLTVIEAGTWILVTVFQDRLTFFDPQRYLADDRSLESIRSRYDKELGWDYRLDTPFNERRRKTDYGRPLIGAYGDSYTYCDDVEDDETWPAHLSDRLQADVLNWGVNGYGTDQAYLKFLKYHAKARTPVVMLGVVTENIKRIVNVYRPFYYPRTGLKMTKPRFILSQGRLELIENPIASVDELSRLQDPDFVISMGRHDLWLNRDRYPVRAFPYSRLLFNKRLWLEMQYGRGDRRVSDLDARPWDDLWEDTDAPQIMLAIMDAFVARAQASGALPVILILPRDYQVKRRLENPAEPQDVAQLLAHCESRAYLCFDGVSAMAEGLKLSAQIEQLYDNHLNTIGNQKLARALAEFLRRPLKAVQVEERGAHE